MSDATTGDGVNTAPELDFEMRRHSTVTGFEPMGLDRIEALITPIVRQEHNLVPKGPPILQLDARHPYEAGAGWLECYQCGRWDADINLIMLDAIRQTGPSPGEWDGSVLYGYFIPPANGNYVIAVNFTGFSCTVFFNGPWGTKNANLPFLSQPPQPMVMTALTATTGKVWFTVSGRGFGGAYVSSILIYNAA